MKNSLLKKSFALVMSVLMIVPIFIACEKNNEESITSLSNFSGDGMYDENGYLRDDLGNDLDFGGNEVSFLCWSDRSIQEFDSAGTNSDIINDSIYYRNVTVQERLKVKLNFELIPGNFNNSDAFAKVVENEFVSGRDQYNIYASYGPLGPTFAQRGFSADMNTLDYLNFKKPWWPENIFSELSIANKLFFVTGDISTNLLYMMHGTFCNMTMLAENAINENPYELVKSGKWTIEKLKSMASGLYSGKGDSSHTAEDIYGYTVHKNVLEAFVIGAGIKSVSKDQNDLPVISSDYSGEKMINLVADLGSWLNTSPDVWMEESFTNARQMFESGRALFITDKAYIVTTGIKEITDTYCFLPMPKYNESQEDYCTDIGNTHTVYSISNKGDEKVNISAAVIECMASESYRQVMPVVFETIMKTRYSVDQDASEMYDIMRRTITFDFGKVFSFVIGKEGCDVYKEAIFKNTGGWSSTFKTIRPKLKGSLDTIINEFQ